MADELVMYEKVGVIANRIPSKEVVELMDVGDMEIVAAILNDGNLAEYDIKGENIFYLPENSGIVEGAKTALEHMGI